METEVTNQNEIKAYSSWSEPCDSFVGHPSEPCERCGFSYWQHR